MNRALLRRMVAATVMLAVSRLPFVATAQVDPQPQDAATAILSAFDRYDIVGMSAGHGNEKQDQFISALVRHPGFPLKVNDIVVECGNSRYQPILDRYIAGDDVPIEEARQTWRDTSVLMCALSGFYHEFFSAIRALNRDLPKDRRVRVIVGEPPVDWSAAAPSPPARSSDRNPTLTAIMVTEVLEKHRKALVLVGVGHLYHNEKRGTAVTAYEAAYPGRTFVIEAHNGFAAFFDLPRGHELEARMRSWPAPSLVVLKGSWLASLDLPYFLWPFPKRMAGESFADLADAYLYLGPGASLTYERTPEAILNDQPYMATLARRFGGVDVDALRRRNLERTLFTPADREEARTFAPGVECVGIYAGTPGGEPVIEIDFSDGRLSARLSGSNGWTPLTASADPMRYELATPSATMVLTFELVGRSVDRVTLDSGGAAPKRVLVRSS